MCVVQTAYSPRTLDCEALRTAFFQSAPLRHVVIDDFFEVEDALAIHHSFPVLEPREITKSQLFAGRIYGPPPADHAPPALREAFAALASRSFVRSLSHISGIEQLAMDETHEGSGLHIGLRGSALPIHADHNTHPKAAWLYRRLNLMVYLNPNWQSSWTANLLLYDETGSHCVSEIEPRFNRAVLMGVSDRAYHGYRALDIPSEHHRQSLASYYYALEPDAAQVPEPHGTIFSRPRDIGLGDRIVERVRRMLVRRISGLMPKPSWPK